MYSENARCFGVFVYSEASFFMLQSMRRRTVFILFACMLQLVSAQKVGLVLSGGGAKGIAHIGMLQALEENGIPIDYITGTSIGAVVGGLYAMGYSPAEMLELVKSDDFKNWRNGTVENRYLEFYRRPDPTPEILMTSISLRDSIINPKKLLPNSLLNPIQLNFAFLKLCSQATGQCSGDFDKLFVPFRSVASNVYTRKSFVFKSGDLGDAIRASMTFPFVFKAIKVNGNLLYDGAIYNNYPVNVMKSDFNPDLMIGSMVDNLDQKPDDYDMMGQLKNMILHSLTDTIPPGKGIQLNFNLDEIALLDFEQVDTAYKIGYEGAMAQMDSIKKMIIRRSDPFALELKRTYFKSQAPDLRFREIQINGVTDVQRDYLLSVLKQDGTRYFSLEEFKVAYFKMLENSKIKEIIPHAIYLEAEQAFRLVLDVEVEDNIDISIGANLSSSISNQLYLGINYQILNEFSQIYTAETYLGKFLNAFNLISKFNFNGNSRPQYFSLQFTTQYYNYFQDERLYYQSNLPAFVNQLETYMKFRYGFPLLRNGKMELSIGGAYMLDTYTQKKLSSATSDAYDKSIYGFGAFSVRYEQNSLNLKQYATSGFHRYVLGQFISGIESFRYGDTIGHPAKTNKPLNFYQFSGGVELYKPLNNRFIIGTKGEFVYNNKRLLDNYTSSIIQAPAFTPTPHSMISFNEAFRSDQYIAIGLLPIWNIRSSLFLRGEFYGFFPLQSIYDGLGGQALTETSWSHVQNLSELALVYQLPVTNISLFLNRYSFPKGNWNFGVNLGFLLFAKRFIE